MSSKSSNSITIQDVFDKDRDPRRELNLIVKVADTSERNIWTEFEEFVLTEALLKHIHQFYTDFSASISFDEPKMPFWLEGFYGSGKSHLSKIIGHLIQNSQLTDHNGNLWTAIKFFTEHILKTSEFETPGLKKKKMELIEGLELLPKQINAKTIFINLSPYSKSEVHTNSFIESFTSALLKEFNMYLGLAEIIQTAELEKNLIKQGLYDEFKKIIQEREGESWEDVRKTTSWARETFLHVYTQLKKCDLSIAQEYLKGADMDSNQKTVVSVLKEINDWAINHLNVSEKGIVGKVLIVLDEAGLFFSSKASRIGEMMAVAEWINTPKNESHINMIFSAQQSIKTYLESVKSHIDHKTAEQRFKKWDLDKKNIKTVVVQRWLKKDVLDKGKQLQKLLDDKYHAIIDGTVFDTIKDPNLEYKRPTKEELFQTYPFLPNQFPVMIQVTQKLISEQMVEEQYGGKTRSILSMTRDVLNNKLVFSDKKIFLEENLGSFVIVPQLYDTITYTLKNKDEDQFRLVENTKSLVEDPSIFTEEERNIPISFNDIAKTVLLLKYIDEVCVNDETIIKALFYSIDLPKIVFTQKVKKLISELKKKGYLTYKKRQIEDKHGKPKDLIEYQIPSQEERKYIEKTQHVPINPDQVQKWLEDFFKEKEGFGKDLIEFKIQNYLQSLINHSNQTLNLENGIRLKFNWYLDPNLDEILGKISEDQNIASICVLTNRLLKRKIDNLKKFSVQIQTLCKKAIDRKKLLIFIAPNLLRSTNEISQNSELLLKSIQECIRYQETKNTDLSMPGNVQVSFEQRISDIKNDVLDILKEDFTNGVIFYAEKQEKVDVNTLQNDILNIIKQIYSKINPFAYLGQIKFTKSAIEFLLKWDPKKQAKIPIVFKRNTKNSTSSIPIFDEKDKFKPKQTEQYGNLINEFNKYLLEYPGIDNVPADHLMKTFKSSPYGWNGHTLLVIIVAIIRNNEWEPILGGSIKQPHDKEIVDAFTNPKKNYEKFQQLKFKTAETISQEELTKASDLLRSCFTEHVSQISREFIKSSIKKVLMEIQTVYSEVKPEIEKFRFGVNFLSEISSLVDIIDKNLKIDRSVAFIKSFIEGFEIYEQNSTQKDLFEKYKKTLYRIRELKTTGKIEKYHKILNFLTNTYTNWSSTQLSLDNIDDLNKIKENALDSLNTPQVLSDASWTNLWSESKQLWDTYWNSYINLHDKLITDIQDAITKINDILASSGISTKINTQKISKIFTCKNKIKIPGGVIDTPSFICQKCKKDYNALRVFENSIQTELTAILNKLKIPPPPPPPPPPPDIKPDNVQKQSWQKYQDLHKEIEVLLAEILNLKKIHSKDQDLQKIIKDFDKWLSSKFKSFDIIHLCSSEPEIWIIEKQACQHCKVEYSLMLDLHSEVNENYNKILVLIKEKQQEFPEKDIEIIFDLQAEQTMIENLDEHIQVIKTIISSYRKNNPDVHQNIKIKIRIEKGD
jgi:hypothetical protein